MVSVVSVGWGKRMGATKSGEGSERLWVVSDVLEGLRSLRVMAEKVPVYLL